MRKNGEAVDHITGRFFPSMVTDAYLKTGLRPIRDKFFDKGGFACGLGMYYVHYMGGEFLDREPEADEVKAIWEEIYKVAISPAYAHSFACGFDCLDLEVLPSYKRDSLGYQHGILTWYNCLDLGLVEGGS